MYPISTIDRLLIEATSIVRVSEEKRENEKGRDFNIFSLLDRDTDEVKCHSRLIAELLNPNGSHGMDSTFLVLFLERLSLLTGNKIEYRNEVNIIVEKFAPILELNGRIDIYLELHDCILIIENKIYAGDQNKQLENYDKYARSNNPKNKEIYLFYLTRLGSDPSINSLGTLDKEKIYLLSYKEFVSEFIQSCTKQAVLIPVLRETLFQYNQLIKQLTGDDYKMSEVNKVVEQINSKESIKAALLIKEALNQKRILLEKQVWGKIKSSLGIKLKELQSIEVDFQTEGSYNDKRIESGSGNYGIYLKISEDNGNYICYCLNKENGQLYLGLRTVRIKDKKINHDETLHYAFLFEKTKKFFSGGANNTWWVLWTRPNIAHTLNINALNDAFLDFVDEKNIDRNIEILTNDIKEQITGVLKVF